LLFCQVWVTPAFLGALCAAFGLSKKYTLLWSGKINTY
jgi:hypothetical protein